MKLEFSPQIFEKYSNIKFHQKIYPVGAELFQPDGQQTDTHDEANSRFSHFFFANAPKYVKTIK